MRALVLSDLHLEFGLPTFGLGPADVVVLAGDIDVGIRGVEWAAQESAGRPVVYVPGNHEYYTHAVPRLIEKLRRAAGSAPVHVLDGDSVTIGGVRFLGATLWTDFELMGDRQVAMSAALETVTDYRKIRVAPSFRRLRPSDTASMHGRFRRWLEAEIEAGRTEGAVIVTHHAPSPRSLAPASATDLVNASYASDLEDLVASSRAALWIHGHTHHCVDYGIGMTRVVSNQRGYVDSPVPGFEPGLTLDLQAGLTE